MMRDENSEQESLVPEVRQPLLSINAEVVNVDADTDPKTVQAFMARHFKNAGVIVASFDFSMGAIALQIDMGALGAAAAAPVVITGLNVCAMLAFASMFESYLTLSHLYGERYAAEKLALSAPSEALSLRIEGLKKEIAKTPKRAFVAGFYICPIIIGMEFSDSLLSLLQQVSPIPENAKSFFGPYGPFFFASIVRFPLEFLLLAAEKQVPMMYLTLPVLGQWFFAIFKNLGLPALGYVFGGAGVLPPILFALYIYKRLGLEIFNANVLCSWSREDWFKVWQFIIKSWPTILSFTSEFLVVFSTTLVAGSMSLNASKAWDVCAFFLSIDFLLKAAAAQAGVSMIARLLGDIKISQDYHLVRKAFYGIASSTMVIQAVPGLLVMAFPQVLQYIVGVDEDINEVRESLAITIGYAIADGFRFTILQHLRAMGYNIAPAILSSICLWLGFLLSEWLRDKIGLSALPLGLAAGSLGATAVLLTVDMSTLYGKGWNGFWQKIKPDALREMYADMNQNDLGVRTEHTGLMAVSSL